MNINKVSKDFTKTIVKIVIYVIIVIVLYFVGLTAYKYGQKVFVDSGVDDPPGTDIYVSIPPDSSVGDAAKLLESYGVIDSAFIFRLQSLIYETKAVVAGDYRFNTSYNGEELLEMLRNGPEEETEEGETGE